MDSRVRSFHGIMISMDNRVVSDYFAIVSVRCDIMPFQNAIFAVRFGVVANHGNIVPIEYAIVAAVNVAHFSVCMSAFTILFFWTETKSNEQKKYFVAFIFTELYLLSHFWFGPLP